MEDIVGNFDNNKKTVFNDREIGVIFIQAKSMTEHHFKIWFKNYMKKHGLI